MKPASSGRRRRSAGGLGIGPRLEASKAPVLPLDDPPIDNNLTKNPPLRHIWYNSTMKNITVSNNILTYENKQYKCSIGAGGVKEDKSEGDKSTPSGYFPIRKVFYRADRVEKPESPFETIALESNDGWCDDPNESSYNTHIKLPHQGSHENLWRDDEIYDIIVVLGHNDEPVIKGKGSAVFMHIARPDYSPTDGCIALSKNDLLDVLIGCDKKTKVCID